MQCHQLDQCKNRGSTAGRLTAVGIETANDRKLNLVETISDFRVAFELQAQPSPGSSRMQPENKP